MFWEELKQGTILGLFVTVKKKQLLQEALDDTL